MATCIIDNQLFIQVFDYAQDISAIDQQRHSLPILKRLIVQQWAIRLAHRERVDCHHRKMKITFNENYLAT